MDILLGDCLRLTCTLTIPNDRALDAAISVVNVKTNRVRVNKTTKNGRIIIEITSDDVVSMRAILNSYLRILNGIEKTNEVIA